MAHSVELRLPFLEHDLLEFALSLNTKYYFFKWKVKVCTEICGKRLYRSRVRLKKIITSVTSKYLAKMVNKRIHK